MLYVYTRLCMCVWNISMRGILLILFHISFKGKYKHLIIFYIKFYEILEKFFTDN